MTTEIHGSGTSRVVQVRWAEAVALGGKIQEQAVQQMLDHAVSELGGWSEWAGAERRISIKVNTVTCQAHTHPQVAGAVARGLVGAGAQPERTTVWDHDAAGLKDRGYILDSTGKQAGYRCVGWDSEISSSITIAGNNIFLCRLLTEADLLISVAALKDHSMAGVSLCLKNNFGMIQGAERLHGNIAQGAACEPGISELAAHPEVKGRLRLAIIDALVGVCQGGPGPVDSRYAFRYGGLLVGLDPVAVDRQGLAIIQKRRERLGLVPLEKRDTPNPSPPVHIDNAAQRGVSPA